MKFNEVMDLVYGPYKELGFYDQWNQTDLKQVFGVLNNLTHNHIMELVKLNKLNTYINKAETIRSIGEIGLFCEEVGELLDAIRKNYPLSAPRRIGDKSVDITSIGEECADLFIRLSCFCRRIGVDLEGEILKKNEYNKSRAYLHGKKA